MLKRFITEIKEIFGNLVNPYEKCYNDMEDSGDAVFGMCCGLYKGTKELAHLSEYCIGCPYLSLSKGKVYAKKIRSSRNN